MCMTDGVTRGVGGGDLQIWEAGGGGAGQGGRAGIKKYSFG